MWMLASGTKVLVGYFEDSNQNPVTGKALDTINFDIYYVDGSSSLAHIAGIELGRGWYGYTYTDTVGKDFIYTVRDTTAVYKNFPGGFVELQIKSVDNVYTDVPVNVWTNSVRTLTSFGTLVADISTAVWGATTRTLTSFGTLVADVATAVWGAGTRTLTSFGTLVADTATAVWGAGTRTLTSFGTLVSDIWSSGTRTLTSFGTLVADIATAVWGATTRTLTDFTAFVDDIWNYLTSNLTTPGSIGKFILDQLNAISGGGTAGYVVTVTVRVTATTTPIMQVRVVVRNSDDSAIVSYLDTSSLGQAVFNLTNGTYKLYCYKFGDYTFTNPTTITVAGSAVTQIIYGTPFTVGVPTTPNVCRVYGWEYESSGLAIEDVPVTATPHGGPYWATNTGITVTEQSTITNTSGYWYLDLVYSASLSGTGDKKYTISIEEANYLKTVTVPSQASVNVKDLV